MSQANVDGLIAGGEFESPLTAIGKAQAKKAGQELKDKNIEVIVSSPMGRALDTAKIIAKEINIEASKIVVDKAFTEVFNGTYSGKPYALRLQHIKEGKLVEDIEHPDKVLARVKEGLSRINKLPEERILLVSHGATGRMIRAVFHKISHHDYLSHASIGNTEIYEFTLE